MSCNSITLNHSITLKDDEGNDSNQQTLRDVLIGLEQKSIVDYELAGHNCARPPGVCQGQESEDRPKTKQVVIPTQTMLKGLSLKITSA